MNRPDFDSEIAEQDEYGNTTIKEDGLSGSNFDDPNNPQAHGFHNVPVECEDSECADCPLNSFDRKALDCPYVDENDNDDAEVLKCECGNEEDWVEETIVSCSCDAHGNREEIVEETTKYFCGICSAEVWFEEPEN